jgi:hypothetical protein
MSSSYIGPLQQQADVSAGRLGSADAILGWLCSMRIVPSYIQFFFSLNIRLLIFNFSLNRDYEAPQLADCWLTQQICCERKILGADWLIIFVVREKHCRTS